ncbi:hypothetical protein [Kitasatospora sp. NPDC057500]|uniref:hypothetical protein n=1 Tax=Kitasatospora sp. NPDC057500 TaxID=3346151 RepID=UPI0036C02E3D
MPSERARDLIGSGFPSDYREFTEIDSEELTTGGVGFLVDRLEPATGAEWISLPVRTAPGR